MLVLSPYGQSMSCFDAEDQVVLAADVARMALVQVLLAVALGIGVEVMLRGIGHLRGWDPQRRGRTPDAGAP